ncbi:potassium channel subfamily T member 1 [Elysia marginata]|uniref:Potassium channel subfamily T member 1 n=1 Tax=Elysia marginata TaxID=1093978 RepID=A0AAV4IIW9_9GAST|nr:potassium channel subfamily T member 1 [Elysia marginata]
MSLACAHDDDDAVDNGHLTPERQEIIQMVKCRMQTQGLPLEDYNEVSDRRSTISYVIINPSYDLKLELGDIVYVIRPSSLSPQPSPLTDERKLLGQGARQDPTGSEHADLSDADTPVTEPSGDPLGLTDRGHRGHTPSEEDTGYTFSGGGGRVGSHDNDLTILSQDSSVSAPPEIPVIYFDQGEQRARDISSSVPDNLGQTSHPYSSSSKLHHATTPDSNGHVATNSASRLSTFIDESDEDATSTQAPRFTLYPCNDQATPQVSNCSSDPSFREPRPNPTLSTSFPGLKGTIV